MKKAILFLLLASPVSAEFTDQEKAEIIELERASEAYALSLSRAFSYARVNPAAVSAIREYAHQVIDLRYNVMGGLLGYLDREAESKSRADVLAGARAFLNAAKQKNAEATKRLSNLEATCRMNCAHVQAARASFDSGNVLLNGFDATLAYADPILPDNTEPNAPGALRGKTPIVHPHGLHSAFINNAWSYSTLKRTSEKHLANALLDNPAAGNIEAYWGGHIADQARFVGRAVILAAGAEHPNDVAKIDQMESFSTTVRSRHFFRILFAAELLINVSHGVGVTDVTGRLLTRGFPYSVNQNCIETGRWLRDNASTPDVQDLGRWLDNECGAWASVDNMASQTLVLREFTVVGRPPLRCGGGGTCPDPSSFCDPLTTAWDGAKCVALLPVCPEVVASVTSIGIPTVQVQCVPVP